MPDAVSQQHSLALLFDRDSASELSCWLPTDAQLTQWVNAALARAPAALYESALPTTELTVEVSLTCVAGPQMRDLNAQYRAKDSETNVLSFPADMPILPVSNSDDAHHEDAPVNTAQTLVLGDVIICPSVLETEAEQQGKTIEAHWAHMVVHSVLHLHGMEHETDIAANTMESLEIQILSEIGMTNPYLADSARQS